jgi:putative aminopeptidase FrvX
MLELQPVAYMQSLDDVGAPIEGIEDEGKVLIPPLGENDGIWRGEIEIFEV